MSFSIKQFQVALYGSDCYAELRSNCRVGPAEHDQAQHVDLAVGETITAQAPELRVANAVEPL